MRSKVLQLRSRAERWRRIAGSLAREGEYSAARFWRDGARELERCADQVENKGKEQRHGNAGRGVLF